MWHKKNILTQIYTVWYRNNASFKNREYIDDFVSLNISKNILNIRSYIKQNVKDFHIWETISALTRYFFFDKIKWQL